MKLPTRAFAPGRMLGVPKNEGQILGNQLLRAIV
jgi:hypothetical protein